MEFWGVEVKPGQPLKVRPEFGKLIHISQAALGEVKDVKGAKYVPLRMKIDDKNFIIGTLSAEERPQLMFDLVIEREFELSHGWKNGSVFFIGYIGDDPVSDGEDFSDDSEDEPVGTRENGEIKPESGDVKLGKTVSAAKAGSKKENSSSDEDEDGSDSGSDEGMADGGNEDSSDGSEEEEDSGAGSSEEELPQVKQLKKRLAGLAQEAPVSAKKAKAKSTTPEKTGGNKKGSKAAGKAPVSNKRK